MGLLGDLGRRVLEEGHTPGDLWATSARAGKLARSIEEQKKPSENHRGAADRNHCTRDPSSCTACHLPKAAGVGSV